jgi:hypothetical protein
MFCPSYSVLHSTNVFFFSEGSVSPSSVSFSVNQILDPHVSIGSIIMKAIYGNKKKIKKYNQHGGRKDNTIILINGQLTISTTSGEAHV